MKHVAVGPHGHLVARPSSFRLTELMPVALLALMSLCVSACGSGGPVSVAAPEPTAPPVQATPRTQVASVEPTAVPPTAVPPAAVPPATPTPAPTPEPERTIQDVAVSTVKIIAEGTFVPPFELEESLVAGIGTGFIIDDEGTLVTNNHVVTGATFIEVYLDGATEPTGAQLLGVSECSDLALLDLDGDGYDFLEFRTMDGVRPGLPVFAAGYPLNLDTDFLAVDYTLTAGIVSTTQASGETNWASVDAVIEHDARIRGGNSGGPLVDEEARVVGINFAGEDTNDLNEAIAAAEALPTIEALRVGDVESLGINGQAVVSAGISGVWVSAVAAGTPADRAGIVPGDLIVTMDNTELATDGTMSTYCDILRDNGPDAVLAIEVLRIDTEEVLAGQINGNPLVQTLSLTNDLEDEMVIAGGAPTDSYASYELVTDESGTLQVEVPTAWTDQDGAPNDDFGESIYASTDLTAFLTTWDAPGIIVERSRDLAAGDIDAVLDDWDIDCATSIGREDFETEDGAFAGKWQVYTDCGDASASAITMAVSPPDGESVIRIFMQIITDADIDAAERAIATFNAAS